MQPKKCTMPTTRQRYERSTYCVVLIAEEWTGNGFNDTHINSKRERHRVKPFAEKPKKARRGNTLSCRFGYCIIAESSSSSSSVLNQAKGKLNLPRIFSTLFHRPKTTSQQKETRTKSEQPQNLVTNINRIKVVNSL